MVPRKILPYACKLKFSIDAMNAHAQLCLPPFPANRGADHARLQDSRATSFPLSQRGTLDLASLIRATVPQPL